MVNSELWDFLSSFNTLLSLVVGLITIVCLLLAIIFKKDNEYKRNIEIIKSNNKLHENQINDNSYELLSNVEEVKQKITNIIKSYNNNYREIKIDNFGLDLSTITIFLQYSLTRKHLKYRALIVNINSDSINSTCGNGNTGISIPNAKKNLESIRKAVSDRNYDPSLSINVVSYDHPPVIHGFLMDDSHLFISLTRFVDGKLYGGDTPYLYLKRDDKKYFHRSVFSSYKTWFEFHWENGNKEI